MFNNAQLADRVADGPGRHQEIRGKAAGRAMGGKGLVARVVCGGFFGKQMMALLIIGCTLNLAQSSSQNPSGTWPQWRGPQRDSTFVGNAWPRKLDETRLQLMWRHEIGHGYSGPIVSEDTVFTVETRGKKQEIVRAFDRQTGDPIWQTAWDGSMKVPFFAARNGS